MPLCQMPTGTNPLTIHIPPFWLSAFRTSSTSCREPNRPPFLPTRCKSWSCRLPNRAFPHPRGVGTAETVEHGLSELEGCKGCNPPTAIWTTTRLGASRSSCVLSLLDKQRYPRWQIAGLKSIPSAVVSRGSSWSLQERRNPPSKGSCIPSLCCRTSPAPLLQRWPVLWQRSAGIQKTSWIVRFLPRPFTSLSSLRTALKNRYPCGCQP